ncbi:MFS transporter [Altererythrobacter sp. KTW20L]|uniref:NTP/NDP exchange transporter n=1 Tax=Altererythrobacter sp. KTW20L TaxID=2942210 RepID=UPI0020C0A67D|nr:MFS transporter [Altererythrobacter sp. KTW20L]MCL6250464.1 MFS transporter [Altererythrobacter sp. KTW20L]
MTASDGATLGGAGAPRGLARLIVAEPEEVPAVAHGFGLFFFLFASYFMLRPVRETFAIAGGVDNIQWLWTGTFVATLVVVPLYGWVASRMPRRQLLPILYSLSAMVMCLFAFSLWRDPDNVWIARGFYIWLSVMNLFVISIAWSLMADLFERDRGHRLFGQIAAGASLGGLTGPLLSGLLVAHVGEPGLLMISTALLMVTLVFVRRLLAWRERQGPRLDAAPPDRMGGSVWAGLSLIARSPYLLAISGFVMLLTTATTFLYFEQARIVEATFPDRAQQTQVFAALDVAVQSLTIGIQLFFTGRLAKRLGVTVLLVAVPATMMFGFGLLAMAATFPVLAFVMIVRRVGEYALVRPGREMLFAPLDTETKYKAKNAIDTLVYRGGDLVSGWAYTGIVAVASLSVVGFAGMAVAGIWAALGFAIGRRHDREPATAPA